LFPLSATVHDVLESSETVAESSRFETRPLPSDQPRHLGSVASDIVRQTQTTARCETQSILQSTLSGTKLHRTATQPRSEADASDSRHFSLPDRQSLPAADPFELPQSYRQQSGAPSQSHSDSSSWTYAAPSVSEVDEGGEHGCGEEQGCGEQQGCGEEQGCGEGNGRTGLGEQVVDPKPGHLADVGSHATPSFFADRPRQTSPESELNDKLKSLLI